MIDILVTKQDYDTLKSELIVEISKIRLMEPKRKRINV